MFNEVVTLVEKTKSVNAFGDLVSVETCRDVFAELKSIGQSEFYQAAGVGLKPEIKVVLPDYMEWNGEETVRYQAYNQDEPVEYSVLRTYRTGNQLELVLARGVDK